MSQTSRIAIDAMGGDFGPAVTIAGAALALAERPDLTFRIFGNEHDVLPVLSRHDALRKVTEFVHTDKMVHNDDKPSVALRAGKDTSMRLAIEAVQQDHADCVVSAGNTGALMAMSKMVLKTVPGIHRPAIASVFPSKSGDTIMLDLGANIFVDSETLVQFAVMGAIFARAHKAIIMPSVALLNVGSEDNKGPDNIRDAAKILKNIDFPGKYVGFVEGNDIPMGGADVIVCDGYAGNIALKTAEGVGKMTGELFQQLLRSSILAKIGGLLAAPALRKAKQRLDPRLYNGGVFLGLNGICVKSHGGTDALGFSKAVLRAASLAQQGYVQTMTDDINHLMAQEYFVSGRDL